ncbi:MAG: hypothetical protein WAT92_02815 [Saprospiraceae bacterium]
MNSGPIKVTSDMKIMFPFSAGRVTCLISMAFIISSSSIGSANFK